MTRKVEGNMAKWNKFKGLAAFNSILGPSIFDNYLSKAENMLSLATEGQSPEITTIG